MARSNHFEMKLTPLYNGINTISHDIGILKHIFKLPILNGDPNIFNYGVMPANSKYLSGYDFTGKSAGCGYTWSESLLGAIGETVERYTPAFFNPKEAIISSYKNLNRHTIHPKEYALFHPEQYKDAKFSRYITKFEEDTSLTWIPSFDLTNNLETYVPAQMIHMPFRDRNVVNLTSSTGLSAHTNYHQAILGGLFECIERDSFSITWYQKIVPPKIELSEDIKNFLKQKNFNETYEWHFFDITYDLKVPTTFGFCIGETEYGKFLAVGASTRGTLAESLKKTIQEIGQSISCFRFMLDERRENPVPATFDDLWDFDEHSWLYMIKPEMWTNLDRWRSAIPNKNIDFNESNIYNPVVQIREILKTFKNLNYNVLFKDLTTPDLRQIGFFSIKIFIPQLIQLSGAYILYHLGGERMYSVPEKFGHKKHDFENLNKDPHPFP